MRKRFFHNGLLIPALIFCCTSCANVGVRVHRDPGLENVSIQVDVIGITKEERAAWNGTNVTKYWTEVMNGKGNPDTKPLQFSPGQKGDQTAKISTKGNAFLVVISDYPNISADKADKDLGDADQRLSIISLDKYKHGMWTSGITVQIDEKGIKKPIP